MTTTRIPAFVTAGARNVPVDGLRCTGHTVDLTYNGRCPHIARIEGVTFGFGVTIDGLSVGLHEEHVEPYGRVTISPSADGHDFRWVVVDIDNPDGTNAQVWLGADKVAEFLVDVALSRILPRDTEFGWPRARRTDGGAA